jgi:TonB family protein
VPRTKSRALLAGVLVLGSAGVAVASSSQERTTPDTNKIGNGVYRPGRGVTTPKVLRQVQPNYPAEAVQAQIQGSVLLECLVGTDGRVGAVTVVRSLDSIHGLDTEAMNAVRQWTFEPGAKDGKPVPVLIRMEIAFTIDDSADPPLTLRLPDAFTTARPAEPMVDGESWQEQVLDTSMPKAHIAYPKGWVTITGLADATIMVQSMTSPMGMALLAPVAASRQSQTDSPASAESLRAMADMLGKTDGRTIENFGQARVNEQLWLWFDYGWIKKSEIQVASALSPLLQPLDQIRSWMFVTFTGGYMCPVTFFVVRMQNVSDDDANHALNDAGRIFAGMLERLSFNSR